MSIQSEITRIHNKRDLSLAEVAKKGVAVPSGSTIDDLPDLIAQIETDTGYVYQDEDGFLVLDPDGDGGGGSSVELKRVALRPDAELIQTYTDNRWAVADAGIEIPAYSTSSQTLKKTVNLTPTITMDHANYDYIVVERFLVIPAYSADTHLKGREEYNMASYVYEIVEIPANTFVTASGKYITTRNVGVDSPKNYVRMLYWTGASAIGLYTSNSYGIASPPTVPAISSNVLTIKEPTWTMRGHTTYFTQNAWNLVTDIHYQYVIEVWRAPKNNLNVDGWESRQNIMHIANCMNNGGILT